MSAAWQLFGRLHPLVLHLPLGLFFGWLALELACSLGRAPRASVRLVARLTAATAVLSAAAGWVLSHEEGYGGALLERHELLGIAAAVTSVAAAALAPLDPSSRRLASYRVFLGAAAYFFLRAGHAGAGLTHGEDWLTVPFRSEPGAAAPVATAGDEAPAAPPLGSFADRIAPILAARCTQCHGASKHKGGLRLHTAEEIAKGSEVDGPVIVPGDAAASPLVQRITLPLEHEDHMPPEGKPQPTAEEIATIVAWVRAGASFERTFELPAESSGGGVHGTAEPSGDARSGDPRPVDEDGGETGAVAAPSGAATAALESALIHAEPIAAGSPLLWIDVAAVAPTIDDAALERLLAPLAANVADLSLARSAITDASLSLVARCPRLVRLDLRATRVTEVGLAALAAHPALEELVLADTRLRDAVLQTLLDLPALKTVVLWRSGLSADALASLRAARPGLRVIAGDDGAVDASATEGELAFTSDRALPGGEPAPASLEPVNTTCPVSGEPVRPGHAIVHEGRVIGFCCPNCPRSFRADPAKYAANLR